MKKLFAMLLVLVFAGVCCAEQPIVTAMPTIADEVLPSGVEGELILTTQIGMDGKARLEATSDPYETLNFKVSCGTAQGPLHFFETYNSIYKLKYNEAAVSVSIELVDYTGSQTIIPQQCMLFTLTDETQTVVRKGYQLQDCEIDGSAQVAVESGYPVTLYKRYTYDEVSGEPMMKYLCVTTYVDGVAQNNYFNLFAVSDDAETDGDDTFNMFDKTLTKGSTGTAVKILQDRLITLGLLSDKADGTFGSNTENAVKTAQAKLGMEQTGVADGELMKVLLNRV